MSAAFKQQVEEYVARHVIGREADLDVAIEPPTRAYQEFHERGLSHWWVPERFGGHNISLEDSVDVVDILAYGDAGLAFTYLIPILTSCAIEIFGTESQQERYLRPMIVQRTVGATAASERGAGSELLRLETTATARDGGFVLRGRKFFSTNAGFAEHIIVVARVGDSDRPTFKAFIVDAQTPGLRIIRRWKTVGLRASATYELECEDCIVPATNVLEGNGVRVLEAALNPSRILIAAMAIGMARRLRDICIEYAKTKEVGGAPLIRHPVFTAKIGQMEMQIEAMRAVCRTAARDFDAIRRSGHARREFSRVGMLKGAAVAKMFCGQTGWQIATVASESLGGVGYTDETLIDKICRDMRIISIIEAGDDVLRQLLYFRVGVSTLGENRASS